MQQKARLIGNSRSALPEWTLPALVLTSFLAVSPAPAQTHGCGSVSDCNEDLLGNFATLSATPAGQALLEANEATEISIYSSSTGARKQVAAIDSQLQGWSIYYNIWNHAVPELSYLFNAGSLLNPGNNAPSGAYLLNTAPMLDALGEVAGNMKDYFSSLASPTYNAAYTVLPQYAAQDPLDPRPFVVFEAINSNPWTTEQTSQLAVSIQQSSNVPSGYQVQDWASYITSPGFPSGHSTAGNTLAILTGIMAPEYYKDFLMAGIEFALSRNVFGVHHPIDTIGGRLIATYNIAEWLNGRHYEGVEAADIATASAELQALIGSGGGSPYADACAGNVVACIRAGAIPTAAEFAAPRDYYTYYLTYGLPNVGTTGLAPVVPDGAEVLIASRFPYLSADQRREVLATTEIDSGSLFDNGSGWARLNLYAAADGFGALNCGGEGATGCIQTVTMSSAAGGYNAFDVWANDISGDGGLELAGDGTLVLVGNATYTGGTTVSGGMLALTGSLVGSLDIASGASFFNAGSVTALGGSVIVNDGTLLNDGTLASSVVSTGSFGNNGQVTGSVASSGLLFGTGTINGDLDVRAGTIAPGNSIGTVTVGGNLVLASGTVYEAEIGSNGTSDLITAAGTATITGAILDVVVQPGAVVGLSSFEILTAASGINGTFASVNDPFGAAYPFLDTALSYSGGSVTLETVRSDVPLAAAARTRNQIAIANALETIPSNTTLADAVFSLNFDSAPAALAAFAGELGASAASVMITDSRVLRDVTDARLRAAAGAGAPSGMATAPLFYAPPPASPTAFPMKAQTMPQPASTAWAQGFGSWSSFESDGNAAGLSSNTGGLLMGADALLADWRLGLFGGYSASSINLDGGASSADTDNWHIGLYAGREWDALAVRLGLANSWSEIETTRAVAFNGFGESLAGDYDATTFQMFGELSYQLELATLRAEPFANLAYVRYAADSYTETGGEAALAVDDSTTSTTFSTLGLRLAQPLALGSATGTLSGMIGWQHAFGDTLPTQTQSFAIGGSPFTVSGVPIAQDAALVEAGIAVAVGLSGQLSLAYGGQFGDGTTQNSVNAALRIRF